MKTVPPPPLLADGEGRSNRPIGHRPPVRLLRRGSGPDGGMTAIEGYRSTRGNASAFWVTLIISGLRGTPLQSERVEIVQVATDDNDLPVNR